MPILRPRKKNHVMLLSKNDNSSDDSDGEGRGGQLYPLREVPLGGNQGGIGFVNVPLNTSEVRNFKKEMGRLLEDPLGVAERLDQFLGPNVYTWKEIQSILGILFTNEERHMIRDAGMRIWDGEHQQGPRGEAKWPLNDPNWNHNNDARRGHMSDLRTIIVRGIKEAVPRSQNMNKAFNEHQGKEESPVDWLERLRRSLQMYSGIDPDTQAGETLLKTQFVAKAWHDIRKKLEKIEGWQEKGLQELLKEAQKVYVRRDEEKTKAEAKLFVAAVRETQKAIPPAPQPVKKNKPPNNTTKVKQAETGCCFYCGKKGRLKRNCLQRKKDEEMFHEQ